MESLMFVQVSFLSKPSSSNSAFERLFSSVDPYMIYEVPSFVEESLSIIIFSNVVPQIPSTFFIELVASWVFVLRELGLLGFFDFEAFRFVEEEVFFFAFSTITDFSLHRIPGFIW